MLSSETLVGQEGVVVTPAAAVHVVVAVERPRGHALGGLRGADGPHPFSEHPALDLDGVTRVVDVAEVDDVDGHALLLRVGDLDRPALLLEGVVDDPCAGHRLDHRADRLAMDFLDAASEPSQRVDVGRYGKLVQMLSLIGEQANVKLLAT